MEIPYIPPQMNSKINQMFHFKQLIVGAGSNVFKAQGPWIWAGATTPGAATFSVYLPTGALTTTGTINATGGTITGDLLVGTASGASVKIKGTTGTISMEYNGSATGTLEGKQEAHGSETYYVALSNVVGRSLSLGASGIYADGTFYPNADVGDSIGSSTTRWNEVWAKTVIAYGTGSKFSCQGSNGISADCKDSAGNKILTVVGGIVTQHYY